MVVDSTYDKSIPKVNGINGRGMIYAKDRSRRIERRIPSAPSRSNSASKGSRRAWYWIQDSLSSRWRQTPYPDSLGRIKYSIVKDTRAKISTEQEGERSCRRMSRVLREFEKLWIVKSTFIPVLSSSFVLRANFLQNYLPLTFFQVTIHLQVLQIRFYFHSCFHSYSGSFIELKGPVQSITKLFETVRTYFILFTIDDNFIFLVFIYLVNTIDVSTDSVQDKIIFF